MQWSWVDGEDRKCNRTETMKNAVGGNSWPGLRQPQLVEHSVDGNWLLEPGRFVVAEQRPALNSNNDDDSAWPERQQ